MQAQMGGQSRLVLRTMAGAAASLRATAEKLVAAEERAGPARTACEVLAIDSGKPTALFPDAYAELSVALIGALETLLGMAGLQRVLGIPPAHARSWTNSKQIGPPFAKEKLQKLAHIRTEGRYMAEVKRKEWGFSAGGEPLPDLRPANACRDSHDRTGAFPVGAWAEGRRGASWIYHFRGSGCAYRIQATG